ncbi:MAG: glycosyltransferase family 4 protein [Alphaproteobacteria bacterium]|nr:glycosyltransferase family 4 protein [Alphaproteobacteria bacterium]
MRVWIITVGEPIPFEKTFGRIFRSGLLAKMLTEAGHEVVWWTSSVDHFSKKIYPQASEGECILPGGIKLIFLKSILYKKNISFRRLINHFGTARHFTKLAQSVPLPDIVLCSFPTVELSYNVVNFCQKRCIPVLVDVRDLYPDVYINLFPNILRPLAKVLLYPMQWMTQKAMQGATGIIAISKTYLNWGLDYAQRSHNKYDGLFPMAYPRSEENLLPASQFTSKFKKITDKKIILYVGSFVSSIDLETVISAAKILKERKNEDFHFVLAGDGGYKELWENMAINLDNVTFTGWIDSPKINWLAHNAWAGLGAYKKDALMSLPNKILEYMNFGLPILSSLDGETREFIEENNCGLYYEAGNPESLIACLDQLIETPKKREEMVVSSKKNYMEKYTPARIYGDFIQHIEKVCE